MSEQVQSEGLAAGKVKPRRVPAGVDISDLAYLEYRDIKRLAEEMDVRPDYVARVKRGESYNVRILAALLKKARENKKALENQAS